MESDKQINCYVFLPVYNGEKYLSDTINSVLIQDYDNYHLIIVDDFSSDKSKEIIASYKANNPQKITTIYHSRNMGVGRTMHELSKQFCNVDYIAQIGQDDIWPCNYLSSQINFLKKTNARAVFSRVGYINCSSTDQNFHPIFMNERLTVLNTSEELFCSLLQGNYLCASSSVISLNEIGENLFTYWGIDNNLLQDYEMWLNLSADGIFVYNNNVTVQYRIHDNNLSNSTTFVSNHTYDFIMLFERLFISGRFCTFFNTSKNKSMLAQKIVSALNNLPADENTILFLRGIISNFFITVGITEPVVIQTMNQYYENKGLLKLKLQQTGEIKKRKPIFFESKELCDKVLSLEILAFATPVFDTNKIQYDTLCIISSNCDESENPYEQNGYPYPTYNTIIINDNKEKCYFRNIEYPIEKICNVLFFAYESNHNNLSFNIKSLSDTLVAIEFDLKDEQIIINDKQIIPVLIAKCKNQTRIISIISVTNPIGSQDRIYIQRCKDYFTACDAYRYGNQYIMLFKNINTISVYTGQRVFHFANQFINQYYKQETLLQKEMKLIKKSVIKGITLLIQKTKQIIKTLV